MPTDADSPSSADRPGQGGDPAHVRGEGRHETASGGSFRERLAGWVRPTPGELVGLSLLVLGSVVATLLWWGQSVTGPADLDQVLAGGAAVASDGSTDGPAPGIVTAPQAQQASGDGAPPGDGAAGVEAAVGSVEPGGSGSPDGSGTPGAVGADRLIDLNRATAAELEQLPGIGPARAAAIVEYRERNGPFAVPGDLRGVSGIGEATFQNLAPLVVVR